jgi:hypothetical protein
MHIFLNFIFLLSGIKWGDWKNWRKYYSTYLFFVGGDLFYNALLHDYRLWNYKENIIGKNLLYGHLIINLLIMVFTYSSTLLIYLGNFPKQRLKQVCWIVLWVFIYSLVEYINSKYLNLIEYHHGWNILWSILFNILMFTVLKIHVNNPLLAWIISILFFIFLYTVLNIPREVFK